MYNSIDVKNLIKLIPNIKIIDIRDNLSFNRGCIPTSVNIPKNFLLMNADNYLNKNDIYYIYCEMGNSSKSVCMNLINRGYKVVNIIGGYNSYKMLDY